MVFAGGFDPGYGLWFTIISVVKVCRNQSEGLISTHLQVQSGVKLDPIEWVYLGNGIEESVFQGLEGLLKVLEEYIRGCS